MSTAQQEDPDIGQVSALRNGNINQVDKTKHQATPLLSERVGQVKDTERSGVSHCCQLVLPEKYRSAVMKSLHDDSGLDKANGLVKNRFYWPRMKSEIEEYCKSCVRCIKKRLYRRELHHCLICKVKDHLTLFVWTFCPLSPI